MRVRLTFPIPSSKSVRNGLKKLGVTSEKEEKTEDGEFSLVCLVDPGQFRPLDELLRDGTQGKGKVELIDLTEAHTETDQGI